MQITVDSLAWLPKAELSPLQLEKLKAQLTVVPQKILDDPETDDPILLYQENQTHLGVARAFLLGRSQKHAIQLNTTRGNKEWWPGDLQFKGTLKDFQHKALGVLVESARAGSLGGILEASCGCGKTVIGCAMIASCQVPTLVVVHKEFLMDQWEERLRTFLPGVRVGRAQRDVCMYRGKHVVLGMIHSLAAKDYGEQFRTWPGLVIFDEVHCVGARTWAQVPGRFPARYRLGLSATPRRKDFADAVFKYHIGGVVHQVDAQAIPIQVRWVKSEAFLPTKGKGHGLLGNQVIKGLLSRSPHRNNLIAKEILEAVKAGRKLLVASDRLEHLDLLKRAVIANSNGKPPTMDFYVGGRDKVELKRAAKAQVIFITPQFASTGLDLADVNTLVIALPLSDVEQLCGRVRAATGDFAPLVVDVFDAKVKGCQTSAKTRAAIYNKLAARNAAPEGVFGG